MSDQTGTQTSTHTFTSVVTPEQTKSIHMQLLILAVEEIGGCLTDLARIIQQGIREDNYVTRGNVAIGLEKAAHHIRGFSYKKAE